MNSAAEAALDDKQQPRPLTETDFRAALFVVAHYLRTVPAAPASLWQLRYKLDAAIHNPAMSSSGHDCDCGERQLGHEQETIGTRLAAEILERSPKWVSRHRDDLGGRLVGDRLVFDAAQVRDYAAELNGAA
ncbi:hypothetical protein JF770_04105 [Mycobacterium intracellulare]|uniref:hypothetical protein n=1 Tax=Mycobacterium intracellulare TaxID=1767 RepID=UPI001CD9A8BC|nr:hypothetical protein [Mycobacterium intracellulare]MCA2302731.1 hypothetical protein [Mycobacterium intracellulare]MCA2344488.1 hypothetical protein [Mycobacterium intracellulare]UGU02702.1 hypothetical protein LTS63_02765 [Mycobacterium intracellulare]